MSSGLATSPDNRRRMVLIAAMFVALLLVAFALWYWYQAAETARRDASRVFVSGRIEGYETNLGAKMGGLVKSISFREGASVHVGDVVAQLSDTDMQAQLRGAEAKIKEALAQAQAAQSEVTIAASNVQQAKLRQLQTGEDTQSQIAQAAAEYATAQARVAQARASLGEAKAAAQLACIRLERYTNLVKKGAVNKDEYDQQRTNCDTAAATVKAREADVSAMNRSVTAALAALRKAQSTRFNKPLRSQETISTESQLTESQHRHNAALQAVRDAQAQRDQIQANINYLTVKCPIEGIVTARVVEPGAVVVPGQIIVSVIDLSKVYLRGFIPESEIGKVRVGQKVRIYLDGMPETPFEGTVMEIDSIASFTPENVYFKKDRIKQVFGIKIGFSKPAGLAKPGMPADAEILL